MIEHGPYLLILLVLIHNLFVNSLYRKRIIKLEEDQLFFFKAAQLHAEQTELIIKLLKAQGIIGGVNKRVTEPTQI